MIYRIARKQDILKIQALWDYCFEKRTDPFYKWYFEKYFDHENVIAGFDNEQLLTCLHLNPYNIYLRGNVFPASYVVGLATFPEGRSRGLIEALLKASFAEMRRRGHYISILMPSQAGFYYPYGYELCYHNLKYQMAVDELREVSSKAGSFRIYHEKDVEILNEIYSKFVKTRHGYVVRNNQTWQNFIDVHLMEDGYIYILKIENQYCGYVMYRFDGDKMVITEMTYDTWAAEQALFGFIYSHRSQVKTMEWLAPLNDITPFRLVEPKQDLRLFPFMTARIIDVSEVLKNICFPKHIRARFTLKITDELATWNNMTLDISIEDSRAIVQEINNQTSPDVTSSIGGLSQLVFGRVSAQQLSDSKKLTGSNEIIAALNEIFPICDNFINEYF